MNTRALSEEHITERLRAAGCVFAEEEARLLLEADATPVELEAMVARRVAGFPLEHILGWVEFCGLRIAVGPGVFVPRRRTEFLVQEAARLVRPGAVVLDLCCGCGALGVALAASVAASSVVPPAAASPAAAAMAAASVAAASVVGSGAASAGTIELYAADIEPAAVEYARRNLASFIGTDSFVGAVDTVGAVGVGADGAVVTGASASAVGGPGGGGRVFRGDLFDALPAVLRGRIDIVLCNTPYVPTDDIRLMPPEARLYEPRVTLDGGADGLDVQRRVAASARDWLAPGGQLLVEVSEEQAPVAQELFQRNGLVTRVAHSNGSGATVVIAARPM